MLAGNEQTVEQDLAVLVHGKLARLKISCAFLTVAGVSLLLSRPAYIIIVPSALSVDGD